MASKNRARTDKTISLLRSENVRERVAMLRTLAYGLEPQAPELVEVIEELLNDRQVAILSILITIGEVRYLAAEALTAIRALADRMDDVVVLEFGHRALSAADLGRIVRNAGRSIPGDSWRPRAQQSHGFLHRCTEAKRP